MRKYALMGLTLFLLGCLATQKVNLERNDVHFMASINDYGKSLDQNTFMLKGSLTISNKSSNDIAYSNKDLFLVVEDVAESRTYLDSLTSHYIDIDTVKIGSGKINTYKVYWALPMVKFLSEKRVHLEWRQP